MIVPSWLVLAIAAALAWATTNLLDKVIVERLIRRPSTIIVVDSFLSAAIAMAGWIVLGIPLASAADSFPALLSGLLTAAFTFTYFVALKKVDASTVAVILQAVPVFSVIAGVVLFDEHLELWGWVGVGLILAGTLLAVVDYPGARLNVFLGTDGDSGSGIALLGLGLGAVMVTGAYSLQKLSLEPVGLYGVFALSRVGTLPVALGLLANSNIRTDLGYIGRHVLTFERDSLRYWPILCQAFLNMLGVYLIIAAYELGPLALVVPAASIQPLFVVVLTLTLNSIRPATIPDRSTRESFWTRVLAIFAVIVGIFVLSW